MHSEWLAWAAGLFEGEGYLIKSGPGTFTVGLTSTDYDVLLRFQVVMQCGKIRDKKPSTNRFGKKPQFTWLCAGANAEHVYLSLRPWLCSRRQARGDELMAEREAYKIVRATLMICVECSTIFTRKFTDKKRMFCTMRCAKAHGHRRRELMKIS